MINRVQLTDSGKYECEALSGLRSAKATAVLEVKGKGYEYVLLYKERPSLFKTRDRGHHQKIWLSLGRLG